MIILLLLLLTERNILLLLSVMMATQTTKKRNNKSAVLKVMKSEHQFDNHNFERHRRDALVMERLSSSHHLVSIYGYCANSVLTQGQYPIWDHNRETYMG